MTKIEKKITAYEVVTPNTEPLALPVTLFKRPEALSGRTYRIRPYGGTALYITINNVEVDGVLHPYELFIASALPDHSDWRAAVSRLISALFRLHVSTAPKDWRVSFIVDELKSIFSTSGYYADKRYYNSVCHHLGAVLEQHLESIGYITPDLSLKEATRSALTAKLYPERPEAESEFPNGFDLKAKTCPKCSEKTLIRLDGCETCTSCGFSSCS